MAKYLIFKNNKLVAHTNEEKILNLFLHDRHYNDYNVEKVKEKELNYHLVNSEEFILKELQYYSNYNSILTEKELEDGFNMVERKLIELVDSKNTLLSFIKYMKFTNREEKSINILIDFIKLIEEDLLTEESSVFLNDYFELDSFLHLIKRYG